MEEENAQERENLFDCCAEVFDQFDSPDPSDEELTTMRFVEWMTRPDVDFLANVFMQSELKFQGKSAADVFYEFWGMVVVLSFAMGYGIGTWRECPDPNIRNKVEKVRAAIEEKGLFRFASRARA